MLFDVQFGHSCPVEQAKLVAERDQGQSVCLQLCLQVLGHGLFFVLPCRYVKRLDDENRRTVKLNPDFQLLP